MRCHPLCKVNANAYAPKVNVCFPLALSSGDTEHGHDGDQVEDNDTDVREAGWPEAREALMGDEDLLKKCGIFSPVYREHAVENVFDVLSNFLVGHWFFSPEEYSLPPSVENEDSLAAKAKVRLEYAFIRELGKIKISQLFPRFYACVDFRRRDAACGEECFRFEFVICEGNCFSRVERFHVEEIPCVESQDAVVREEGEHEGLGFGLGLGMCKFLNQSAQESPRFIR